jgi:ribosomal protein L22
MADEKDPKQDKAAEAEPKKPRVRRKPKAAAEAEPAAAAASSKATADIDDEPAAEAKPAATKAAAKQDAPAAGAKASEETAAAKPRRTRRKAAADAPAAPAAKPQRAGRVRSDSSDGPPMVRAHAKYVRTSARKARLVCDHIRGKSVDEARAILAHASRDVARDWSKLLESAVANAEHNHELLGDDLRIHAIKADEGPTLKRFRPRAMGRATKIRKRTSHLSITLTPKDGE